MYHSLLSLMMGASLCLAAATPRIAGRNGELGKPKRHGNPKGGKPFDDSVKLPLSTQVQSLAIRNFPPLLTSKPFGGTGGRYFDDSDAIGHIRPARVTRLTLQGGARLDAITFTLGHQHKFRHGGDGGELVTVDLGPNEYVTGFKTCTAKYRTWFRQRTRVVYAKASTNKKDAKGNYIQLERGSWNTGLDCHDFDLPAGAIVVGLYGRAKTGIDQLGAIYLAKPE
ncbi:jacalin-like lectin domain protein, putative [Rhizoctonia solani AG-3 Rhs1AP]|uniref:Jacalin-like lectin domain protein, putative n=2 Tax=Rhizoctonia solani AG-3 TaxID=1086053 RepID=X8JGS7_9AGAM|nr:jacalin-like lectin domain protein, putative [Rhizoctonia solani AG-3 Rhs1AP]KEP50843.1 putative jacalin-like lectin domain protein [Rhizoctonia solani 123E]